MKKVRLLGSDDVTSQFDDDGTAFIAGGLAVAKSIYCTDIFADNLESITGLTFDYPLESYGTTPTLRLLYDATTIQKDVSTNKLYVALDGTTLKYDTGSTKVKVNIDGDTLRYDTGTNLLKADADNILDKLTYTQPIRRSGTTLSLAYDANTIQLNAENELEVPIDDETLKMSAEGGLLRVNFDGETIQMSSSDTVEVSVDNVLDRITFDAPLTRTLVELGVAYDANTIQLNAENELEVPIDGETLKMTAAGGLLKVNTDNLALKYSSTFEWLVANGDAIALCMGGMKKYRLATVLALLGLDLGTLKTAIEGVETLLGIEIIPNGATSEQAQSFLTNAVYLSPKYDNISIMLSGATSLQQLLSGDLYCPQVLTAYRGGLERIPYYDSQSLTSIGTFKFDPAASGGKLIVPSISVTGIDRSSTNSYVIFGGVSGGTNPILDTVNSGANQVYWNTSDSILAVSKIKLTNTAPGDCLFVSETSPYSVAGTATTGDFTWDESTKVLKVKYLNITNTGVNNEEVFFFDSTATPPQMATDVQFKYNKTNNILNIQKLTLAEDQTTAGLIHFNNTGAPPTTPYQLMSNANLKWANTDNILQVSAICITDGDETAGLIHFNNSATPYKKITDASFKYDDSNDILNCHNLSIGIDEASAGAIHFNNAATPYKLISDSTKLKFDNSNDILNTYSLSITGNTVPGVIWFNDDSTPSKLTADSTNLLWEDSTNTLKCARLTAASGATITTGGLTVSAGGATITLGGITVSAGGLSVTAGGITVSAGGITVNGGSLSVTVGGLTVAGATGLGGALSVTGLTSCNGALTVLGVLNLNGVDVGACLIALGVATGISIVTSVGGTIITAAQIGTVADAVRWLGSLLTPYGLYESDGRWIVFGKSVFHGGNDIIYTSSTSGTIKDYSTGSGLTDTNDSNPMRIACGVEIGVDESTDSMTHVRTLSRTNGHLYVDGGIRQGNGTAISSSSINVFTGQTEIIGLSELAGDVYMQGNVFLFGPGASGGLNSTMRVTPHLTDVGVNAETLFTYFGAPSCTTTLGNPLGTMPAAAYTVYIDGPPTMDGATTSDFSGPVYSLYVGSGDTRVGGDFTIDGAIWVSTFELTGSFPSINVRNGGTVNMGSSGTGNPLNVRGLITGFNGLTISSGSTSLQSTTLVTGSTLNVGTSSTTSPLNVYGLITGANGLTISSGNTGVQALACTTFAPTGVSTFSSNILLNASQYVGYNNTLEFGRDSTVTTSNSAGYIKSVTESTGTNRSGLVMGTARGAIEVEYVIAGLGATTSSGTNFTAQAHNFMVGTAAYPASGSVTRVSITSSALTSHVATTINANLTVASGSTLNVGTTGTSSPLNVKGLISGANGLTITSGNSSVQNLTVNGTLTYSGAISTSGGISCTTLAASQVTTLATASGTTTIGSSTQAVFSAAGALSLANTSALSLIHGSIFSGSSSYNSIGNSQAMICGTYTYGTTDHASQLVLLDNSSTATNGGNCGAITFAGPAHNFGGAGNYMAAGRIRGANQSGFYAGSLYLETLNTGGLLTPAITISYDQTSTFAAGISGTTGSFSSTLACTGLTTTSVCTRFGTGGVATRLSGAVDATSGNNSSLNFGGNDYYTRTTAAAPSDTMISTATLISNIAARLPGGVWNTNEYVNMIIKNECAGTWVINRGDSNLTFGSSPSATFLNVTTGITYVCTLLKTSSSAVTFKSY